MLTWLRAFGRILLFLGLFVALLVGGTLLVGNRPPDQQSALFAGSVVMALAAVIAGAVVIRFVDHRPVGALGLAWTSRTGWEWGVGLLIGVGALAFAAAGMFLVGGLRYAGQPGTAGGWFATLALGFASLAVPAFAEEALFRGYPFQVLVHAAGGATATLITSAFFAAAHMGNPNVDAFALINIFLAGVLLSVTYLRTRSLWFATAVHLGWNWAMALLFDLPVSGLELYDTPLYEPAVGEPSWFTGGAFGPEGGLIGSLAFGAALVAVLVWPRVRVAPELRALRPLGLGESNGEIQRTDLAHAETQRNGEQTP